MRGQKYITKIPVRAERGDYSCKRCVIMFSIVLELKVKVKRKFVHPSKGRSKNSSMYKR